MWIWHGKIKKRAMEKIRDLGNMAREETLAELGLFSIGFYFFPFVQALRVLLKMGRAAASTKPGTTAPGSRRYRCRKCTAPGQPAEGMSQGL